MRISTLLLALLCVTLCSCDRSPKIKLSGVGDDPTWISSDAALAAGLQLLTNRYPDAQILYALGEGQKVTFHFATNHTTVPIAVIVDRKTGKAKFESASH